MKTMQLRNETVLTHYSKNFDQLCKQLERKANGWHNAEDIVQEAYYRALKHFDSLCEVKGSFDAWFPAILGNCLRSHLAIERLKGACIVNDEAQMEVPVDGVQEDVLSTAQIRCLVTSKVGVIRDVLLLYFFEGHTAGEISKLVPLTTNAVRQTVFRFKQEVREASQ